jgi:hypothetical protein
MYYGFGIPPKVKKFVPNQIYFMWVWWVFLERICFIANYLPVFMCLPNQTKLNPPLPNNFIFLNPLGNRLPNVFYYYSVKKSIEFV